MRNLNTTRKLYYLTRSKAGVIKRDLHSSIPLSLLKRLKMWMLGFESKSYYYYDLKNNDYKNYISNSEFSMTRFINQPYDIILEDKLIFEKVMSQYIKVPKNYALIQNGRIIPLTMEMPIYSIDSILERCRQLGGLVIKPVDGALGRGVIILKIEYNKISMNNKIIDIKDLEDYILSKKNCIITEYIKQGEYANELHPTTVNTIRIMTAVDIDTNKPFIVGAIHRIGSKDSGVVDNFAQGGLSASIDLDTGIVGCAAKLIGKTLIQYERHPDTDALIKGVKIPRWNDVKNKLLQIMNEIPYIKYVGWDIALTDTNIVAIEGNSHPDPIVLQMHGSILKDSRVRKFYKFYSIIN